MATHGEVRFAASDVLKFAPIFFLHPDEPYLPAGIEYILHGSSIVEAKTGVVQVTEPVQEDLLTYRSSSYQLIIHPDRFAGQPLAGDRVQAPLYCAVQVAADAAYVDLIFICLYPYNGAQAARVHVPFLHYHCVIECFGQHQGDVETMTVRVSPDFSKILRVRYEAHGDDSWYAPEQVSYLFGTHPVGRISYHSHGTFNARCLVDNDAHVSRSYGACGFGVDFIDILAVGGPRWQPFDVDPANGRVSDNGQLIFVGLDRGGRPCNDQLWSAFTGRLGGGQWNKFTHIAAVGSKQLSVSQRAWATFLTRMVICLGIFKADHGDGSCGLGDRDYICCGGKFQGNAFPSDAVHTTRRDVSSSV